MDSSSASAAAQAVRRGSASVGPLCPVALEWALPPAVAQSQETQHLFKALFGVPAWPVLPRGVAGAVPMGHDGGEE